MKGGYKIINFKHIPLSDVEHPVLVPNLRAVLDENYGKAVLLTNVVLGENSMDDCFSTVILKSNGRIKLNSYDGYITVDSDSYAHYTEGDSGDPTAEIEEIKEDIQDLNSNIGDLSDLNTTDKSSAVAAINEVNTKVTKTEGLIAYVQTTLTASKNYAVGEQFIYNGLLYEATAAIAQGGTITLGGNCELADSVTEQIKQLRDVKAFVYEYNSETVNAQTAKTFSPTNNLPNGAIVLGIGRIYSGNSALNVYSYRDAGTITVFNVSTSNITSAPSMELKYIQL